MSAGVATGLLRRRDVGPRLDDRVRALTEAVELADGRLDPSGVAAARQVLGRTRERLGLSRDYTVVALAGATGSGKSSLFNALSGTDLSAVGVRRPTTSTAHACVWPGTEDPGPLLDWLGVPRRHVLEADRGGAARGEGAGPDPALTGLVLLDLPDHDSTELGHRLEVDRLVELVDLLVWVLDPQKYADAAVHDRYLRPLAGHSDVMLLVLNQADRLPPAARDACLADLRRLLDGEGLARAPILPTSARTGWGLDDLRAVLAGRVAARHAAVERLSADVDAAVGRMAGQLGAGGSAGAVAGSDRTALVAALAQAAGVDTVVRAVDRGYRARAAAATGWPFVRWVRRLRPDPLRRLHLSDGPAESARTSLPAASPVQRARVGAAVRRLTDSAAEGLPDPWPGLVRTAAGSADADLPELLDRAVAGTDLGMARRPRWWAVAGVGQKLLALTALAGVLWLLGLFGVAYLQLGTLPVPHLGRAPWPTLLLVVGLLGGLLLALLSRRMAAVGARRRAARARRRLQDRVGAVADEHVLRPVEAELAAHDRLRVALAQSSRRRGAAG